MRSCLLFFILNVSIYVFNVFIFKVYFLKSVNDLHENVMLLLLKWTKELINFLFTRYYNVENISRYDFIPCMCSICIML